MSTEKYLLCKSASPIGYFDLGSMKFFKNWDYHGELPDLLFKEKSIDYPITDEDVLEYLYYRTNSTNACDMLRAFDAENIIDDGYTLQPYKG